MRALRILPIVAVLLSAAPASAQVSIWLKRGVSGFGVNTGVSKGDDTFTFGVGGGYSYQGWIDFDLTLLRTTFDESSALGEIDAVAYGISPAIQFHPIKQSKTIPLSLALTASFTKTVLSSDAFEGESGGGTVGFTPGAAVYRFFRLGERTGIIPAAAINVSFIKATLEDFNGNSLLEDDTDTIVAFSFGAYIAYLDAGDRIWGVVPQITIAEGEVEFGISIGIIFSQGPKEAPAEVTTASE